ncbi:PREDICTED: uncharacterized protein LOC105140033 isoform X2 [Populus euphratica]|uniref:Uncharacterized protein LOC105140033 isoform X2 n=1 Tax=Populus euphratica TaxID=75702 RepID=A0AAJ6VC71_POPEU|nr:PREDICTED: uncharacterized protein LOC105140033 isoform X2 [Populus euphratica]
MQCRCSKNFQTQSQNRNLNRRSALDRDLLNFALGCGQDVVFDFSSDPKLKRFVIGANERQLHYVFTLLSKHVPRMSSLTVKTSLVLQKTWAEESLSIANMSISI